MLDAWKRLPRGAKDLIIYYSITSVYIIGDIFLPIYLFKMGWTLISLGVLYTYCYFVGIIGSIIIGRMFDAGFQPKWAMVILEISGFFLYLIYALYPTPELIYFGEGIFMLLNPLSVCYQTVERELYPEDMYEATFALHMALPSASQLLGILIVGFYLTYILPDILGFKILYLFCAALSFASAIFIVLRIPKVEKAKVSKLSLPKVSKEIAPFVIAELIILFGYAISPQFVYLNFVYNVAGLNLFLIAITISFANFAGIIGSVIAERGKSSFRNLSISIIAISLSYALMYTAKFFKDPIEIFILSSLFAFLSYAFHTIWLVYHRTAFYERVPKEIKGTIFGALSSLRRIVYIITPIVSAIIASSIGPLSTFIISALIISTAIPFYAIGLRKID